MVSNSKIKELTNKLANERLILVNNSLFYTHFRHYSYLLYVMCHVFMILIIVFRFLSAFEYLLMSEGNKDKNLMNILSLSLLRSFIIFDLLPLHFIVYLTILCSKNNSCSTDLIYFVAFYYEERKISFIL